LRSIDQRVRSAVAGSFAALMTETHLEKRARRGSRQLFQRVLRKVRSAPSDDDDRLCPARVIAAPRLPSAPGVWRSR
jgi:hypothetical protein